MIQFSGSNIEIFRILVGVVPLRRPNAFNILESNICIKHANSSTCIVSLLLLIVVSSRSELKAITSSFPPSENVFHAVRWTIQLEETIKGDYT